MKLTELEPRFIRYETRVETRECTDGPRTGPVEYHCDVATLAEAQGIEFLCPKCYAENRAQLAPGVSGLEAIQQAGVGVHAVQVSFAGRGVLDSEGSHNSEGQPSRWTIIGGTGFEDLQLSPSIFLKGSGCGWHGFIGTSGAAPGEVTSC